ncbi:MAG: tetratricopeptide repeat protein [Oceanospirillaceae bacterium]
MDFKRTKLTVLITAIIATGCSANKLESNTEDQGYCRNGGASSDFSCNENKAVDNAQNTTADQVTASNPNTEAWMNSKLSDIKSWLKTIKENPNSPITSSSASNSALMVRNPAATHPQLKQIEALTQRKDNRGAMAAINTFLAENPNNLEAELTKGLVLSNMGEIKEAESMLRNAITRHPTSPELYNNLAVLYSNQGDYGKAIETLLLAFSTHPSYAQVNENLREVYASVASLAYNRALDLDSDKKFTPQLITLRRVSTPSLPAVATSSLSTNIAVNNSRDSVARISKTVSTIATAKPVPVKKLENITAKTKQPLPNKAETVAIKVITAPTKKINLPLPKLKDSKPTIDIAKIAIKPKTSSKPNTVKKSVVRIDNNNSPKTAKAPGSSTLAAVKAVNRWSWTWTSQNVSAYLGSYVSNYSPKASVKHSQWRALRSARLTKPSFIKVDLSNVKSRRIGNNLVEVTFLQKYQANTYKDQTKKRLVMQKVGSRWLISQEENI